MANKDWSFADLAHYVILYAILLATWVPLMSYWNNNVGATAASGFVIFVIADKILHKLLKV